MKPIILTIGGHDPTGGAGIQADIEAIGANGGQALTIPTAITLQDSHRVTGFEPVSHTLIDQQAKMVLADFPVAAIKIGMVASTKNAQTIAALLRHHATLPVIFDPVLAGGGGGALSGENLVETLRNELLPLTTLATPNRQELQRLGGSEALLQAGCQNLLITGTDSPTAEEAVDKVTHQLLQADGGHHQFEGERLPHSYHGSGCTLASAIATRIAQGDHLIQAIETGLHFTHNSLLNATHPTNGQHFPNRLY